MKAGGGGGGVEGEGRQPNFFQNVVLDSFIFDEKLGRLWKMCSSKSIDAVPKPQICSYQPNENNINLKYVCRFPC